MGLWRGRLSATVCLVGCAIGAGGCLRGPSGSETQPVQHLYYDPLEIEVRRHPLVNSQRPDDSCESDIAQARNLARAGSFEAAEALLTGVMDRHECRHILGDATRCRGIVRLVSGDLAGADLDFTAAIVGNPRDADAMLHRRQLYRSRGMVVEAEQDFEAGRRLDPALFEVPYGMLGDGGVI